MSFARRCFLIPELSDPATRERAKALVVGGIQSVGRIGSQTANTVTLASGCCSSSLSNAEDPRRQTGHVGESSRIMRMPSDVRLKSSFRESSESLVKSTSGGWPIGARCPAKYRRAPRARTTAAIATNTTVTVRRTAALRNHAGK